MAEERWQEAPPPGHELRLPTLLPEPVQLMEDQRLRIDEHQLPVVAKRDGGHSGGDAAAAQHLKYCLVRSMTSRMRRGGDRTAEVVGDRDGKSPDDTSRHPSRRQPQLRHRSVDAHAGRLPLSPGPSPGPRRPRGPVPALVDRPVHQAQSILYQAGSQVPDGIRPLAEQEGGHGHHNPVRQLLP